MNGTTQFLRICSGEGPPAIGDGDRELIAAVPAGDCVGRQLGGKCVTNEANRFGPGQMSVCVID
jgi:hypothetical protein